MYSNDGFVSITPANQAHAALARMEPDSSRLTVCLLSWIRVREIPNQRLERSMTQRITITPPIGISWIPSSAFAAASTQSAPTASVVMPAAYTRLLQNPVCLILLMDTSRIERLRHQSLLYYINVYLSTLSNSGNCVTI